MYRILILLFLGFLISCNSQKGDFKESDHYKVQAMLDYKDQNYEEALSNFKSAIDIVSDDEPNTYLFAAASALHLDKDQEAMDLIIQSIINTNTNRSFYEGFEEFMIFRENQIFDSIEKKYKDYSNQYYSNLEHPEINKELDSLIKADQNIRTNGGSSKEMIQIDSTNIARLIEITEQYGYQKKGWLLLWHQRGIYKENNWIWNYFRPVINQEIENGNLRRSYWAQFEEFINVTENGNQRYGLYPHNYDLFPLTDPETVDQRRDSIDLPALWIMNKIYESPLPDNYKKN